MHIRPPAHTPTRPLAHPYTLKPAHPHTRVGEFIQDLTYLAAEAAREEASILYQELSSASSNNSTTVSDNTSTPMDGPDLDGLDGPSGSRRVSRWPWKDDDSDSGDVSSWYKDGAYFLQKQDSTPLRRFNFEVCACVRVCVRVYACTRACAVLFSL